MRKKIVATTAMLALVLAAVAYAQTQQNTYTVTASTSPTKAGSKKKPVPVGVDFDYTVGEVSGQRPAVVKKYSIRFAGLRANTDVAPACSASKLEASGPSACPKKSIVGTGFIENQTGATDNPNDKSIQCNAALSVINLGDDKASIYVEGDPQQSDPRRRCAIQLAAPIPAKFTNHKTESSLDFTVPDSLLHPGAPTISNAVVKVTSKIKRITKKIHGKKRGFFESVGGCKGGKRKVRVIFTPENGSPQEGTDTARCRK
jgi:hypothetical protein